jgi:hypothetical protein
LNLGAAEIDDLFHLEVEDFKTIGINSLACLTECAACPENEFSDMVLKGFHFENFQPKC